MANEAINLQSGSPVYDRSVQAGFAPTSGAVAQSAPPLPSTGGPSVVADVAQLSALSRQADRQSHYKQIGAILRYTNQTLGEVQTRLGEMHDALEGIAKKLYPPYPLNSPERVALLNKVSSLRHQIDALTYPPEDKWLAQLVGDPAKLPGAGDIVLPAVQDESPPVVNARPAYAGIGGLNLPELPAQASDAAVADGLARVEHAQLYVKDARAALYQETAKLFGRANEDRAVEASQTGRELLAGERLGLANSSGAQSALVALS